MKEETRAAAGAFFLDSMRGKDWADLVDLRKLNLANGSHCVLGQLYGDYSEGLDAVFGGMALSRGSLAESLGFTQPPGTVRLYSKLTAAWKALIKARKRSNRRGY